MEVIAASVSRLKKREVSKEMNRRMATSDELNQCKLLKETHSDKRIFFPDVSGTYLAISI